MGKREGIVDSFTPTEAEKKFISTLGSHSGEGEQVGREELLRRYERTLDKRYHWDGIDLAEVLYHLKQEQTQVRLMRSIPAGMTINVT